MARLTKFCSSYEVSGSSYTRRAACRPVFQPVESACIILPNHPIMSPNVCMFQRPSAHLRVRYELSRQVDEHLAFHANQAIGASHRSASDSLRVNPSSCQRVGRTLRGHRLNSNPIVQACRQTRKTCGYRALTVSEGAKGNLARTTACYQCIAHVLGDN